VADVEAPGGEKWEHLKSGGNAMASYPKELAQDVAYQNHTSRLTELWSLPRPAQGLNTNTNKKIIYVHKSSYKIPGILVDFKSSLNFLDRFSRNFQISNFMKILPVGAFNPT